MHQVPVDTNRKTITAQGGVTWKDVDEAGAAHGLETVGGTVNHNGRWKVDFGRWIWLVERAIRVDN